MTTVIRSDIPISGAGGTTTKAWYKYLIQNFKALLGWATPSTYNATFDSGYILTAGPSETIAASIQLEYGSKIPNPSGTPAPALLLGSGPGINAWIVTDQAYTTADTGNNLGMTAGETQPGSTQAGGLLQFYGGGADKGTGGAVNVQGGTSANANGGAVTIAGGNSTNGGNPGDVFIIGGAGQAPAQGANVHLIMSEANSISGDVRIRVNSTILMQFLSTGEIFLTASGTGSGAAGQVLTSQGVGLPAQWGAGTAGFTGTITTAKLTGGGANGSMTFTNGLLTAEAAAT